MKTVEFFSGTQSFSKVAREREHTTICIDNNRRFKNDISFNMLWKLTPEINQIIEEADVIWMSPPCTTFSLAAGSTHWTEDHKHKTEQAVLGKRLLDICWAIAERCKARNKIFFIENPRARARWFLPTDCRNTIWYCQYGDTRAKPTDVWTNLKGWTPKICHNFTKEQMQGKEPKHCHHEEAPRGSKTGTQGLSGNKERSEIPGDLFRELFPLIEAQLGEKGPELTDSDLKQEVQS